jgi:uncharacterized protein (DUF1697 family)
VVPGQSRLRPDVRVALLRGINVGTAKRVSMASLRQVLEDLGYADVRTLLNSGNVVFTAGRGGDADIADRIHKAVASRLGVTSRVIVLSAGELAEALDENPLAEGLDHPSRLLIMMLADVSIRKRLAAITRQHWTPEAVAVGRRAAYIWCPDGLAKSPLVAAMSRAVGEDGTARNLATMRRLRAMVGV